MIHLVSLFSVLSPPKQLAWISDSEKTDLRLTQPKRSGDDALSVGISHGSKAADDSEGIASSAKEGLTVDLSEND